MNILLQAYPSSNIMAGLVGILFLMGFVTMAIFYLITLQNILKAISPQNRTMEPGMVWLMLIPLFNLIWHFIVVNRIDESAKAEYEQKDPDILPATAKDLGLTLCVLSCLNWIPVLGYLTWLAGFICFIIYWTKMSALKKSLESLPPAYEDSQIFGSRF